MVKKQRGGIQSPEDCETVIPILAAHSQFLSDKQRSIVFKLQLFWWVFLCVFFVFCFLVFFFLVTCDLPLINATARDNHF